MLQKDVKLLKAVGFTDGQGIIQRNYAAKSVVTPPIDSRAIPLQRHIAAWLVLVS